ncbi:MAG: PH domain-containing protein [Terriglobales bacterium]
MAGRDAGFSRNEISSTAVSIVPIPVEEYDRSNVPATEPKLVIQSGTPDADVVEKMRSPVPSHHVAKYLFSSEHYVGEWRSHWIKVAGWVALGVLSPFPAGYLVGIAGDYGRVAAAAALAAWLLGMLFVGWHAIEWWHGRFVLTNKRVMLISGLLSRRVGMMPLARVTDMAYEQSPLGMMLNYGSFILESAGQDQALSTIKPLPHPRELYLLFCQEMYDPDIISEGARANSPEGDAD